MFVHCKYAKSIASYEPVKHGISDKNVCWRQKTQAAACFHCLPQVQYKNKHYNHLDDVSWLAQHAINLVGCDVDSALSCEAIHYKAHC